jgi:hypothetical protein
MNYAPLPIALTKKRNTQHNPGSAACQSSTTCDLIYYYKIMITCFITQLATQSPQLLPLYKSNYSSNTNLSIASKRC